MEGFLGESFSSKVTGFFSGQKELIADFWTGTEEEGDASRLDKASGVAADFLEPIQNAGSSFVQKNDLEHKTSEALSVASGFWKPAMAEQKEVLDGYWKKDGQADHSVVRGVTSHLSLILGRYQDWSLGRIGKLAEEDLEKYPKTIANMLAFFLGMDQDSQDENLVTTANKQLERLRDFTGDKVKDKYYRIVVKESEAEAIINTFTSGATIYPTSNAIKALDDDEVAAILAHELGHASQNHNISTLLEDILPMAGAYFGRLCLDSLYWIFTGDLNESLAVANDQGVLSGMMSSISVIDGREVEKAADEEGVRILIRAGISPENLKSALVKLTLGVKEATRDSLDNQEDQPREYPDLMERLENIDRVIAENTSNLVANDGGR